MLFAVLTKTEGRSMAWDMNDKGRIALHPLIAWAAQPNGALACAVKLVFVRTTGTRKQGESLQLELTLEQARDVAQVLQEIVRKAPSVYRSQSSNIIRFPE